MELAASILTADFTRLGDELRQAFDAGVSTVHVDVMDGQFVPNLSMGPEVVRAVRSVAETARASVAVHLMVVEPERFVRPFIEAGAQRVYVHVEQAPLLTRTLQRIRELGAQPSVAINPATPLGSLEEVLGEVASVLLMSVDPGFGGQRFNPASLDKITRLRTMLDERRLQTVTIAVDGGINADNIAAVKKAGAQSAIVGSGIFNSHGSPAHNIQRLRAVLAVAEQ